MNPMTGRSALSRNRAVLTTFLMVFVVAACGTMHGAPPASADAAILSPERIAEIVASPDRSRADRDNDAQRKPEQVLAFIGLRPGMVALDLSAGGGYTTELLARGVGPHGRVYGHSAPRDPASTRPASPLLLAERAKNPAVAHITPVVRKFEDPIPPELAAGGLDLVTLMFNYHDLGHMGVDRQRMNRAVFEGLRPGGIYVIADHSGRPGTGISESGTLHRIEEAFLRQEVEAVGFKLVAQGDFLRNPSDPRDKNRPDPPQPKDEFILKFIKP